MMSVRVAWRGLARRPGFTAVAAATLAVGIGASTAVFSLVEEILLRDLGYPDPDRLVVLFEKRTREGMTRGQISPGHFYDLADRANPFSGLAGFESTVFNHVSSAGAERINGAAVTESYFDLLGARTVPGRLFEANAPRQVLVSDSFWRRRLNADPAIAGQPIALNGAAYTVAGVLPPGFAPLPHGAEIFIAITPTAELRELRGAHTWSGVARLRAGVPAAAARKELDAIAATWEMEHPSTSRGHAIEPVPIEEALRGSYSSTMWLLMGAVILVLLIACANVAGMLLARGVERAPEMAIRAALGASRARILGELALEGLALAAVAGSLGALLATWILDALMAAVPATFGITPASVRLDGKVLALCAMTAALCGLLVSLAPAIAAASERLRANSRTTAGGRAEARIRRLIVTGECALGVVLLAAAGLMLRSVWLLEQDGRGFNARNALTFNLQLPYRTYGDDALKTAFERRLTSAIRALPAVESAGLTSHLPMSGQDVRQTVHIEGREEGADEPRVHWRIVTPGYFPAMQIQLIAGRLHRDGESKETLVVINQTAARRFWPGLNPLGRRIRFGSESAEVIGVVADVRHWGLGRETNPEVYFNFWRKPWWNMNYVVRAGGDVVALTPAIRAALRGIDAEIPLGLVARMESMVDRPTARRQFLMSLLTVFAALAMLLAMVGLYGQLAYSVARRQREIGIRAALGASRGEIAALVFREGMGQALPGVLLGLAGAAALGRLLDGQLYEVHPNHPAILAAAAASMLVAAVLACSIPVRRALERNPLQALNSDSM
ncbi:MAG: ABC transporter permease [Acidobacteria bacterium]|nr:ABC transporter permease [Acidobacteriota bacterium]